MMQCFLRSPTQTEEAGLRCLSVLSSQLPTVYFSVTLLPGETNSHTKKKVVKSNNVKIQTAGHALEIKS